MAKPSEWDEYELTEFFGVLAQKDEDESYLSFNIEKDGLRLLVTLFHYDLDVHLNLFRDGIPEPLLETKIMSSAGAKHIAHETDECLELGASDRYFNYYGKEWIASMAVRIRVNPHISIELFRPEAT